MALVHCEECGRQVSDKAFTCLGCGFPLSQSIYLPEAIAELESGCDGSKAGVVETVVSASPGWNVFFVHDDGEGSTPIIAWSIQTQRTLTGKWRSKVVSVVPIFLGEDHVSDDHLLDDPDAVCFIESPDRNRYYQIHVNRFYECTNEGPFERDGAIATARRKLARREK